MYTLKAALTGSVLLLLVLGGVFTALVWALGDNPQEIDNAWFIGTIFLKTFVVMVIIYPGIIILNRNMNLYENKARIIRDMKEEQDEGPILFDVQEHRDF